MNSKILIVDDEADICEIMSRYLTKKEFHVLTATSGQEAITKLVEEKPDLILLDIRMPDMDGLECLRQIRKLDKDVLVVMSSGIMDEDIAKRALELGAVDYIAKPLDFETIHTAILVYLFRSKVK